jgi:glycerol-3-phosphate dehydrogenase
VHPREAVHRFAGVRPLLDDGDARASAVTRDYRLDLDTAAAPLLSVLGGKLTTFRRLAEEAMDRITAATGHGRTAWTARALLPGGDLGAAGCDAFASELRARWPWLGSALAQRLARAYGTRVERIVGSAECRADLGADLGAGLHEAELDYLRREEWAVQVDDVLWRRSKLGLRLSADDGVALDRWMHERLVNAGTRSMQ